MNVIRNKNKMARLLLFASMLLLAVPLIPHHHHFDGATCLTNDVAAPQCPCESAANTQSNQGCTSLCMAHIESSTPSSPNYNFSPQHTYIVTLYTALMVRFITCPDDAEQEKEYIFIESIFSSDVSPNNHFRAPPFLS